ncbi:LysR family transcriptional regulator ArgP [Thalassotalea algicola]|uniref:LysR family transcriptional regulator ArgP n=1 Tax=Thalassotalea algicola TaxID=2716224 RepID=UPI001B7D5A20|nr:LysR family transcriptional regulator ArgP [Thalassotalea algicola]
MRYPIDYKLLTALEAVMSEQSFERAASKLAITQSAISQRIKQLELLVAQPVIIRTTPLTLTDVGQKLLKHFKEVSLLQHQLVNDIFPEQAQQKIKIAIALNADTLASWFIPAISPLLKKTNIELDLHVANEQDTQSLLSKGKVFGAVSSQEKSVSGCKSQYLGELDYILCASPEFQQKYFSNGLTKDALRVAPSVDFDANDNMHSLYIWQKYNLAAGEYPCHRVRSSEAFVNLAIAGNAYTLLPMTQAKEHLLSGTLVNISPENSLVQKLYWHSWILEQGVYKRISMQVVQYAQSLLAS